MRGCLFDLLVNITYSAGGLINIAEFEVTVRVREAVLYLFSIFILL